jgi:2-aminoadipate transaminase
MPEYLDAADVLAESIENNVAFVPGTPFYPYGGGKNSMRINFSNASPENIREGIQRLGNVLAEMVDGKEKVVSQIVK